MSVEVQEIMHVEEKKLNELWLEFLESHLFWFLLNDIPEHCIEELKTVSLTKLSKYMDDMGTGEGVLYWDIRLTFSYKGEWMTLYSYETDPEWQQCDWSESNDEESKELSDKLSEILSFEEVDNVLSQFLEDILNEAYALNI